MPAGSSSTGGRPAPGWSPLLGLVVVALLLALSAMSVWALRPPAPAAADAPADRFSAGRAIEHVQQVAAEPHVAGSAAGDRVVDYLTGALTELGLDTRVQNATGASYDPAPGTAELARVRNVVGVLRGSESTGRIFLVAHHDSIQVGPGAADDASGVGTILETVRALSAGEQLRNDVVVVFTDAEEACVCGAEAFVTRHPLAPRGGVVLNFEARGTTGPPIMFETSPGDAELAAVYATSAPHPVTSSVAAAVYRALPRDTDFSAFLDAEGFTGLNNAFIDGAAAYHTPQDTPVRLDQRSLQAQGDNALALTRDLGNRELGPLVRPAAADATYFPLLGELVQYPADWVWPLAGAALGAVLVLALVARGVGESSLPRTLGGTLLAALPLAASAVAVQGAWLLLVAVRPEYTGMTDPWRPAAFRLAAIAIVLAVVLTWYALLRGAVGAAPLVIGALVWLAVLGAVLAALAPGGSYLASVPALAGSLTGIAWVLTRGRGLRAAAALVGGAVAVLVLAPTIALFFPALGLVTGAAPAFLTAMLVVALLPALDLLFPDEDRPSRLASAVVPVTAAVLVVALATAGLLVDRFDSRHPAPSHLMYALDSDAGQAWWASDQPPGPATAAYLTGEGPPPPRLPYVGQDDVRHGAAEVADLTAPEVEVVNDVPSGTGRQVTVRVTPQRTGVRLVALNLSVPGGTVVGARVEGRAVPDQSLGRGFLRLTFHAPPEDGVEATLTFRGADDGARLLVADGSTGLEGLPGFESRPDDVAAAGSHSSDLVLVSRAVDLG